MKSSHSIVLALLCSCNFGDRVEIDAPQKQDKSKCPENGQVVVSVDSYPTAETVIADVEIIGTLYDPFMSTGTRESDNVKAITSVLLRASSPAEAEETEGRSVVARSGPDGTFAIWSAIVPLSVLLEPNQGPGMVVVEAYAVAKRCEFEVSGKSKQFNVGYPPLPVDATVDGP